MKIAIIPVSQYNFLQAVAFLEKLKSESKSFEVDIFISHPDINDNVFNEIQSINKKLAIGKIIDVREQIQIYKKYYNLEKIDFNPQYHIQKTFNTLKFKVYDLILVRNILGKTALELVVLNFIKYNEILFVDDGGREYYSIYTKKSVLLKTKLFNFLRTSYLRKFDLPSVKMDLNKRIGIAYKSKYNIKEEMQNIYETFANDVYLSTTNKYKVLYAGTYSFKKGRHSTKYEVKIINEAVKKASEKYSLKMSEFVYKPHPKFFTLDDYNYFKAKLDCSIIEYDDICVSSEMMVVKLDKIQNVMSHGSTSLVSVSELFAITPIFVIPRSTTWPHVFKIEKYAKKNNHELIYID